MSWIVSLKILKYDKKCLSMIPVWNKYSINLCVTSQMQRLCHEIDM